MSSDVACPPTLAIGQTCGNRESWKSSVRANAHSHGQNFDLSVSANGEKEVAENIGATFKK
jgi:hypothetical protein